MNMMVNKFKNNLQTEKKKIIPMYKSRNPKKNLSTKAVEMGAINEESKESINFLDSIEEIEKQLEEMENDKSVNMVQKILSFNSPTS